MSLETSSEDPTAWWYCMRASVHADGVTCCSRYIPVVTAGLGGTGRSVGSPHSDVVNVETTVVSATRWL